MGLKSTSGNSHTHVTISCPCALAHGQLSTDTLVTATGPYAHQKMSVYSFMLPLYTQEKLASRLQVEPMKIKIL